LRKRALLLSDPLPAHWLRVALDPPRAFGTPPVAGLIRAEPEDFVVDEDLGFSPDGDGSHWLLRVRKRGANTEFVARVLAQHAGVRTHDVGFAGLKDRHAVTTQWFTVPRGATRAEDWISLAHAEFSIVEVQAHRRKLRRGALAGNRFRLRIRDFAGDHRALHERIGRIALSGVPNYFGEQRFGREANNIRLAMAWATSGRRPGGRSEQSFALSAARSLLFNAVLAARVERDDWAVLEPGDVANLAGSNSVFAVAGVDSALERRVRDFDVHPTGPLWGAGRSMATGAAAELEERVAGEYQPLADLLATAGLRAERRSLRIAVAGLTAQSGEQGLELEFRLPAGAFATSVLRELVAGAGGTNDD
jgi:tRNA pseudouridine13 synthase